MAIDIFEDLFVLELANNHWGKLERGLKIIDDFAAVVKANGVGVFDTLKAVAKLVLTELKRGG